MVIAATVLVVATGGTAAPALAAAGSGAGGAAAGGAVGGVVGGAVGGGAALATGAATGAAGALGGAATTGVATTVVSGSVALGAQSAAVAATTGAISGATTAVTTGAVAAGTATGVATGAAVGATGGAAIATGVGAAGGAAMGGGGAAVGTACVATGPPGWIIGGLIGLGATATPASSTRDCSVNAASLGTVTWDCWRPVLRQAQGIAPCTGKRHAGGMWMHDLLMDKRVASVTTAPAAADAKRPAPATKYPDALLSNVWGEKFRITRVVLPSGEVAAHASRVYPDAKNA